jgi:hypothetical protein
MSAVAGTGFVCRELVAAPAAWLAAGLLALSACGGGELDPSGRAEPEARAEAPASSAPRAPLHDAVGDVAVELDGPPRVMPGRMQSLADSADDLRRRIDPEGDDSRREKIAVRFEQSCARLFEALMDGDAQGAGAHLADEFAGFRGLFPEFGEARFDDGSFTVFDHPAEDAAPLPLEATLERARASFWAEGTGRRVTASVVAIEPVGEAAWRCQVELRIFATVDGSPSLLDVELEADLREAEDERAAPLLLSARAAAQRWIRRARPTFQDISGHVLTRLPHWEREVARGIEDSMHHADRIQIPFGTGMLGMALGDVNGDGLEDVYLSQIGGFPNRLLLHQEDGSVVDGALAAGVAVLDTTRGCLLVDLDGDDDLDLCVAREADIVLFWNDGAGKFSAPQLLDGPGSAPIYSLSAADPDLDGDLDLFAARYLTGQTLEAIPTPYHDATNGAVNQYWRNDGRGVFTLAGEETGLTSGAPRYSFVSLWEDFDDDGRLDLYVVNDFGPNNLYRNEGGKFSDIAAERGMLDGAAGMGISVADVELDGDLDIYVTNMYSAPGLRATAEPTYRAGDEAVRAMHRRMAEGNSLLLQTAPGQYAEGAAAAGVDHGGWAWGAIFHDWNLDGLPDIYVPNGFISAARETDVEALFWRWIVRITPPPLEGVAAYYRNWSALTGFNQLEGYSYNGYERNFAYLNLGGAEFADVSPISDVDFIDDARVAARLDWDGDGLEDLLLVNRTGPRLRLLRNAHPAPGHRVVLELHGLAGSADAVSARIRLHRSDGKVVTRTVYAGEGLLGQSSRRQFFGLGDAEGAALAEVRWPDGTLQRFEGLSVDRGWRLYRDGARAVEWAFRASPFADLPAAPAAAAQGPITRLVLGAKLPLRHLSLQRAGRSLTLAELPEQHKLLVYWDPESRTGEAFLRRLATLRSEIRARGTILCPVALESAASDGQAVLEQLGIGAEALSASKADQLVLSAILLEVLGLHDDIELPISLLLDSGSNLCALYFGEVSKEELLQDLQRMRRISPTDNSTAALSRGAWLGQPRRDLSQMVRALQMIGARDLAADLQKQQ